MWMEPNLTLKQTQKSQRNIELNIEETQVFSCKNMLQ